MSSHHHKQKIRRRRKMILRVLCAVLGIVLLFFGTGEIFQGSTIMGIALVAVASVLLMIVFTIKSSQK